ncbi:MAG: gamma-butyrobetaine hydroxylase-like domain-containing protein [Myxococcota bacterium]
MKPSPEFTAKGIHVDNDRRLVQLRWGDGKESLVPITRLRGFCPCAECQGHGGDIRYVKNEVHGISGAEPVGRYAILFRFSDGHDTGIFRFEHLRKLDPDEETRWGRPEEFLRQA